MSVLQRCCSTSSSSSSSLSATARRLGDKDAVSVRSVTSFVSSGQTAGGTFLAAYLATCAKRKTRPLQCVKIDQKAESVEICGDRMTAVDWRVALEALRTAGVVSTHRLRVRNKRYAGTMADVYDTFSGALEAPKNLPAVSTAYVVREIAATVGQTLADSAALVCLELENIPFDDRALDTVVSGVAASRTLQHLSLANCRAGDRACVTLCRALRDLPNVRSVDLTGCALSRAAVAGPGGLADLIKRQQYKRHEECWAHSLRSRSANPDAMLGLRRFTLNDNPALGDDGIAALLEPLMDDRYIKAIDAQNCGLTDRGARRALATLTINDTLVVLDLRNNARVSGRALDTVMGQLYENNTGRPDARHWKWTKVDRWRTTPADSSATLTSWTTG